MGILLCVLNVQIFLSWFLSVLNVSEMYEKCLARVEPQHRIVIASESNGNNLSLSEQRKMRKRNNFRQKEGNARVSGMKNIFTFYVSLINIRNLLYELLAA